MRKLYNLLICPFLALMLLINGCEETAIVLVPSQPTNLIATAVSENQIQLSWIDNSNNESGFKIERKSDTQDYSIIANTEEDEVSFVDYSPFENTTYTYRVIAFNSNPDVSNYSNESSATTPAALTLSDIDGNVYPAIQIGTQVWMAENLKTTKFNDGTVIPFIDDNDTWSALNTPGYSWYDNDDAKGEIYGAQYNWYTVETDKLCPAGWHAANDLDWSTLTEYLGGETFAGGKLKESGTAHWVWPNTAATNESGFTALPGGYHNAAGLFNLIGVQGRWWSLDENKLAVCRYLDFESGALLRSDNLKGSGFSVRCVMD